MDGLLIDSEPYWKIAEKKIFGNYGLQLDDELLRQVMGFRLNEVVLHWYKYKPWQNPDYNATENEILKEVTYLINQYAQAMPGVYDVITFFNKLNIPMSVASSSPKPLIDIVLQKLNITNYFKIIHSAQDEAYGKPHPGIFLTVAKLLNIEPESCLVFEDSLNGVIAAKAAKMKCIAIPEIGKYDDSRFTIADYIFNSLSDFIESIQTKNAAL